MATPDTAEAVAPPAEEAPKEVKAEEKKVEEPSKVEEPVKNEEASPEEAPVAEAPKEESSPAAGEEAATGPVEESLPSFKEESYYEKDLKEAEKKALQEFSDKVEAAIKARDFVLPPRVEVVKEITEVAKVEDAVVVATTVEKEVKEVDLGVKIEESAVAVIAPSEAAPEAAAAESSSAPPPPGAPVEAPKVEEPIAPAPESSPAPPAPPVESAAPAAESAAPPAESAAPPVESADEAVKEPEAPSEKIEEAPAPASEVAPEAPAPAVESREVVEEIDTEPPEDLELWGVPLLPSKGDPRTQVIFLKFLRARDFKVKEAFAMLKSCILWRKRYGAAKILEEDLGSDFDASAFNHGVDKEGHPVQYNVFGVFQDNELYQKVFADSSRTEAALRWRVQLLEKQIQSLSFHPGGVTSMLQVVDLKNAPLLQKKGVRSFMSQAVRLLTDNYPELVVKIVFLNAPWYFNAISAFLSPFLTQRMKSKYTIASSLFKFITPDNIPVEYGGLSRPNDADFGDGSAEVRELVLKAGEKKTAEIEVAGGGDTVVWEFALLGSDVGYGVEFVPSRESGYTTIVEKPKKIALLEEPARTSFKSPEPGKLVISVDNSLSRKKKTALYRYIIKAAA